MSKDCNTKNPLRRDGSSQAQRLLKSLLPDYAKPDERSLSNLVNFAAKFAEEVRYFNLENEEEGDWKAFIENDISTLICIVLERDLKPLQAEFNQQVALLSDPGTWTAQGFNELMDLINGLIRECDNWLGKVGEETGFRTLILNGIRARMQEALVSLIGIEKAAGQEISFYAAHNFSTLHDDWKITWNEIPATPDDIPANVAAINPGGTLSTDKQKIQHLLDPDADPGTPHHPLERIFKALYEEMARIIAKAPAYLEASLNQFQGHEPHAALFLTFLLLLRNQQESLNGFTQRHLDFYYREVLGLREKPQSPDHVHLIFDLARNASSHLLPKGTQFSAGKDATGIPLYYQLEEDTTLNKAQVASLKTLYLDKLRELNPVTCLPAHRTLNVFTAPVANSADGLGAPIEGPEAKWKTLGESQRLKSPTKRSMVPARLGFAISSPILWLREGLRTIHITLSFEEPAFTTGFLDPIIYATQGSLNSGNPELAALGKTLETALSAEITGEEGWVSPSEMEIFPAKDRNGQTLSNALTFRMVFGPDSSALTDYNSEIHEGAYQANWPTARFLLDTASYGHLFHYLKELRITKADFHVDVKSLTDIKLQNDLGPLEASKPFMPFGSQPTAGSSFYIGNPEVFSKKLSHLSLHFSWMDPPGNLANYYSQYPLIPDPCATYPQQDNELFTARVLLLDNFFWRDLNLSTYTRSPSSKPAPSTLGPGGFSPINYVSIKSFDKVEYKVPKNGAYDVQAKAPDNLGVNFDAGAAKTSPDANAPAVGQVPNPLPTSPAQPAPQRCGTFDGPLGEPLFAKYSPSGNPPSDARSPKTIQAPGNKINLDRSPELRELPKYNPNTRRGYIKLELNSPDFQHKNFTQLYTQTVIALTKENPPEDLSLPAEPYTPTVKTISLDYQSELSVDFRNANSPDFYLLNSYERFFHIGPFGEAATQAVPTKLQASQSGFKPDPKTLKTGHLFPQFRMSDLIQDSSFYPVWSEGNLYIGLSGVEAPQQISLLFQMAEGTGDVNHPVPKVRWSYLSDNTWHPFSDLQIVSDTTLGLTGSGIVNLSLPSTATQDNSIMPSGLHWIRVAVADHSPAIPASIEVRTQVGRASFADKGNDPQHLANSIPAGTIQKLKPKDFAIKGLEQPYASFGGRVREEDDRFYMRVSERLRHKHRAITIWDYERLVLEEFPDIYKVRCLNHTNAISEVAPGNVRMLVIPNLQNTRAVDPLEPRASVATLERVKYFLNKIVSPFVQLEVANPRYEQVRLKFKVFFKPGFDSGFYKTLLQQDIIRYLSPWAFEDRKNLSFGGKVLRSVLLDFVEERPYVEFLTDFQLFHIVDGISSADLGEVIAQSASSILVSSRSHDISTIDNPDQP